MTKLLFSLMILGSGLSARAEVRAPAAIQRMALLDLTFSPENLDSYRKVLAAQKKMDAGQVLPMNMPPTQDSQAVVLRIADQSVSSFFQSTEVRSTPFGQASAEVEQKLKQEVVVNQGAVQHKFTFQVQAFQSTAKFEYQGYTHAIVQYSAREAMTGIELVQSLKSKKELVLGRNQRPENTLSTLAVRWNY